MPESEKRRKGHGMRDQDVIRSVTMVKQACKKGVTKMRQIL